MGSGKAMPEIIQVKSTADLPRILYLPAGHVTLEKAVEQYRQKFRSEPVLYGYKQQVFIAMPEVEPGS